MDLGPQSEGFVKTTYCKKKVSELKHSYKWCSDAVVKVGV